MRLTLRTMLAYLDDMLEPADAKALSAKIEDSEFATTLVQRIQSCTRRLRLGAPKLDGKGMGLDPNTVAEYLDNTLPQDRVPDFEKVCLESDVHLAEVAASHQILTLVLGEPAQVDPALRERAYAIGLRAEPTESEAAAVVAAAPTDGNGKDRSAAAATVPEAVAPVPVVKKPEVPDYLRAANRRSWAPVAFTLSLAILLIAVALLAMGRLDETHPILGPLFKNLAQRSQPTTGDDGTEVAQNNDADASTSSASPTTTVDAAATDAAGDSGTDSTTTSDDNATAADNDVPVVEPSTNVPAVTISPEADQNPPAADTPPTRPPESTPDAVPVVPVPEVPASDASSGTNNTNTGAPDQPPVTIAEVGRYVSSERKHVLARYDSQQNAWFRLPEREVLRSGDRLLVLSSYRPQVALTSGIQCMFVGPVMVQMGVADDNNTPLLDIEAGSAMIDTAGVAGAQFTLQLADRRAAVTFSSPDATLALEVFRSPPLGRDPSETALPLVCRVFATSGQLQWNEPDQPPLTINAGQMLEAIEGSAARIIDAPETPSWVYAGDVREIELLASSALEALIDTTRPMAISLAEQADNNKVEVSALARASLCLIGEYGAALNALRNDGRSDDRSRDFHSYWGAMHDSLQWAMTRSPQDATKVREAIVRLNPEAAPALFRALQGYTNEQLEAGEDQRLVSMLESRFMEVRVLAMENLRRITGGRTHLYRPERDPRNQGRPLQDWRSTQSKGQIRWAAAAE